MQYEITNDTLKASVKNIHLRKSPDLDLITGYWYKTFLFHLEPLAKLFQNMFNASSTLPDWLTLAKKTLLPKIEQTHAAKNYRPIDYFKHKI